MRSPHSLMGSLLFLLRMACLGAAQAETPLPADVAVVAKYPNAEIIELVKCLQRQDLLDFQREEVRRTICTRLVVKPSQDAVTLEAFLMAWAQETPGVTHYRMFSELKLADMLLKDDGKATDERDQRSREQRAVSWLEKILSANSEDVALQAVSSDRQAFVRVLGARERFHPPPPAMVEERAQKALARIESDAKADAIKLREAAANRLAHLAALVAEKTGNFARFDELVKIYGGDPEVREIFVEKRLRSEIYQGSRSASIPVPKVTPFDGDPSKRGNYLDGYAFGYRSILALVKLDSQWTGKIPRREAARVGWAAGEAQARLDHPEKVAEMSGTKMPASR